MTESAWQACNDIEALLGLFEQGAPASHRKMQLFGLACCRRVWHLLSRSASKEVVIELERLVDLPSVAEEHDRLIALADLAAVPAPASDPENAALWQAAEAVLSAAQGVAGSAAFNARYAVALHVGKEWGEDPNEGIAQCRLLRDICGSSFRPVAVDSLWQTETVLALARTMYESREFSAMPILADALQDAGCDNADILDHCRGPGPHVRGCWVVDLILGKE